MKQQITLVTRKGQVTIPMEIRKALDLKEGDSVVWQLDDNEVRLRPAKSVVARTAGILKSERQYSTLEKERAAMEQAIAEEVKERSRG